MNTALRTAATTVIAGLATGAIAGGLPDHLTGLSVDMGSFDGSSSLFGEAIDDSAEWVEGFTAEQLFGASAIDPFDGVDIESFYQAEIQPGQVDQPVNTSHASMTGQLTQGSAPSGTDISGGASTQTVFKPIGGDDLEAQIEFFGGGTFTGPGGGTLSQGSIFAGGTAQIGMLDDHGNFSEISSEDWFMSWDGINPPSVSGFVQPSDLSMLPEGNGYAIDFSHAISLPVDTANTYSVRTSSFAFTGVNGPLTAGDPFTFQTTGEGFGNTITIDNAFGSFIILGQQDSTGPCSVVDLAEPFGTLDVSDIFVFFIEFFALGDERADFVADGTLDLLDILEFFRLFGEGC